MKKFLFLAFFFTGLAPLIAQLTQVSGKVSEAATGSPIPFANVIFVGTSEGAITDFEGNFTAKTSLPVDSIEVRYIGFVRRAKVLTPGKTQIINFQLDEDVMTLGEVVFLSGENPAFPILRKVVDNHKQNDKRSLQAYEYESYTKLEFHVDNISDKFRNRKIVQKINSVLDSIDQLAGEDGQPLMPLMLSEAISRFYWRNDPVLQRENIIKTKLSAVGITDGTLTSQVIGSTFQNYNFYLNWLTILGKEFVSPIGEGWRLYYDYELNDSLMIDGYYCYRLDFYPKRPQDLAFQGTMWITKDQYALKRIDASVAKSANLNFIERIKIQQELYQTEAGPWLPEKTRVLVDVAQLTGNTAGMLGKFYTSTRDFVINQPKDKDFYLNPVTMEETVREDDPVFWAETRHDSLTTQELNVFQMIDTLKKIRIVKFGMDGAKFLVTGYHQLGTVHIGPYNTFFGSNNIEGVRVGFGAKSSILLSKKWNFGGYGGYGFDDDRWKYQVYAERILSRQPWSTLRLEHQREVEQVWLLNRDIQPNSFFYALSRFGTLTQPFLIEKNRAAYFRQLGPGFGASIFFKQERFTPQFDFQYRDRPTDVTLSQVYRTSEFSAGLRYGRDELFVINDNDRVSLGATRFPIFNLQYTYGIKGLFESDFEYHKFEISAEKRQKMGLAGVGKLKITTGYILGDLPYTLLYNPIGNQTPYYVGFAYNLMDYFEFSTDRYAELRYRHSFEGLFFNGIPLIKRLKWRAVGSANVLIGDMRTSNTMMTMPQLDGDGNTFYPYTRLDARPYVELGYGIENIFRVLSVEAFHRLTYLNQPNVNKFAFKFNIQLVL